jgi:diaminopimelate decarboxylase
MQDPTIDGWLEQAADQIGTPAFVYFTEPIERRIGEIQAAFGGRFAVSFAAKSNPNPALLAWLAHGVGFVDVSSIGEFRLAVAAGWVPERASFTGPGKREFELREAIAAGVGELVVESVREALLADRIASGLGRIQPILVRIAPARVPKGFGDQMAGRPSAFGIDSEVAEEALTTILALRHLRCMGLHIYSGTQCLRPEAICENYRMFIEIFETICDRFDLAPEKLVFGSGLGVPYHDGDHPLDLAAIGRDILPDIDALQARPRFAGAHLVLEMGRYLVGEAGYFVTRVVAVKPSRGSRIAICDGGMNNHLPASGHFGMVIRRPYRMHRVGGGTGIEPVDLVGPLCTSIDRLGTGLMLPRLDEGDLVAVHMSGAYGLTASPIHFISHPAPHEAMVCDGRLIDVTRRLPGSAEGRLAAE